MEKGINWKKGSGELIGFGIVMPILVMIFCGIISASQLSMASETLQYAAYCSCRAAVVSVDEATAGARADSVAKELASLNSTISPASIDCKLTLLDKSLVWQKGNFVRCDVSAYVDTMLPFTSRKRTASIIMMVERPAEVQ